MTENTKEYVLKDKKKLRCGYTTGTCAALAAKAAALFLVTGLWPEEVQILTPAGSIIKAHPEECRALNGAAECAVRKDAGDDYDVTNGILIFSRVEFTQTGDPDILIDGGEGVGRVTRAGLDQPIGAAAINSVPRRMIREAVMEVLEEYEIMVSGRINVTIFAPEGKKAAEKTFNPKLGITGGISILGTSGIVEPMSEEALIETIHVHIRVLRAEGRREIVAVPGNMGAGYLTGYLGEPCSIPFVICSNFIGKTIDLAGEEGADGIVIAGHIGKLVKLGNGIMNTHSREGDGRIDTLVSCALTAGADINELKRLQLSNTTEEALCILKEAGHFHAVMDILCERIMGHIRHRALDRLKTGVMLFDASGALLCMGGDARDILDKARNEDQFTTIRG